MRHLILATVCAALIAGVMAFAASPGTALATQVYAGKVVHVSTENIKVESYNHSQTLSFIVVPKFDQIFSPNGKTTYQMKDIRPGMWVKVFFDQKALGARHADKIIIVSNGQEIKS